MENYVPFAVNSKRNAKILEKFGQTFETTKLKLKTLVTSYERLVCFWFLFIVLLDGCCCAYATNNDQSAFLGGFKEKEASGQSCVVYI